MFDYVRDIYPAFKRVIDLIGAITLLAVLSPLLIVVWGLVRVTSKGPGIFWSKRVGREGRIFNMPKFRTMTTCSKVMSRELATDEDCKLTPIGGFLRKSSLDELPQLVSILMGHMSFIGPRPVLPDDGATALRQHYHELTKVRPGITGLAQVKGRNLVTIRDKVRYDAFYAREMCLLLDAKIILKTVGILHRTELIK